MRITRIDLEHIKSYRRASIPLGAGTIAIRGHNGAGKSTLVEAIGFALFDALGYSHEQFVREGERSGTVTVSFLSALDDREYQAVRRCGSAPTWYIYDPELQARVVEQRQDVLDFLRRHLRLETDIALKDLFNDALGVPQGTFTADFLLTPANRKKKFDTLLQVEDYRKAAEKLNDTRVYLQEQRRTVEIRIVDLERETNQLESWRAQVRELHEEERRLVAYLERVQSEALQVEARREALRKQEAEVARRAGEMQVAVTAYAAVEAQHQDALAALAEAREARRVCDEAQVEHGAHLAAQVKLDIAMQRAGERDVLVQRRAVVAQQLEGATRDLHHAQTRLEAAQQAERRIVELMPLVARQGELERLRSEARADGERLEAAQQALERVERERARVDSEIKECEQQIANLELLRPVATALDERRERVAMLQSIRAQRTERERRLGDVAREQVQAIRAREAATKAEAKAESNVRKIREYAALAQELPELERAHAAVEGEVLRLGARLEQHRLSREQSGAGNCPFLREPCLNIQRKGMNSLGAYFDELIAKDERALAPAHERLQAIASRLEQARGIRPFYDRLAEYEESYESAKEQLHVAEERIALLVDERNKIESWLAVSPGESEVAEAQALFKRSDDADKRLRQLGPLQEQQARAHKRMVELDAECEAQRAALHILAEAPTRLHTVEEELDMLGDPRGEAAGHKRVADERPELEARSQTLAEHVAELQRQFAKLEVVLQPFARLDTELTTLRAELERTRAHYNRYLQHEQAAARVPERQAAVAHSEHKVKSTAISRDRATASYEQARAAFDEEELLRVNQRADDLSQERGSATQDLRHTQAESSRLQTEIARVDALMGELEAARIERAELAEVELLLQQFRETIREAGPSIMKALLRQISTEANRIFGEIMGDRSSELTWENDYEIVLRRDGKERSFAQLSGGEQMSAALAVRLALLRSLTRLDIAFFDEPTTNMDDERRGNLAEQIRRVRGFDQLIIISHDDTFEQGLDSVLHLEKHHGETVLVLEDALVSV